MFTAKFTVDRKVSDDPRNVVLFKEDCVTIPQMVADLNLLAFSEARYDVDGYKIYRVDSDFNSSLIYEDELDVMGAINDLVEGS